jgi:hypothetical protein
MPHKFRGKEQYSLNQGAELIIKKVAPGSDMGEGYNIKISVDGEHKGNIHVNSKKKVYEMIRDYKEYYNTDRAFINEMKVFITYKERQASMKSSSIDQILLEKTSKVEECLNRLFNPDLPLIKKASDIPTVQDATTTEEIIAESKKVVQKFINSNKTLIDDLGNAVDGEARSKLHNSLMKWVGEFRSVLNAELEAGANIDVHAIISALNETYGAYDFIQNGDKTADFMAVVKVDEGSDVDNVVDISTEEKIQNLVDSLNDVSDASIIDKQNANSISNSIPDLFQNQLQKIDLMRQSFYDFIAENKVSDTFDNAFLKWAAVNELPVKDAEVIYNAITSDLSNQFIKTADYGTATASLINLADMNGYSIQELLDTQNVSILEQMYRPVIEAELFDNYRNACKNVTGRDISVCMSSDVLKGPNGSENIKNAWNMFKGPAKHTLTTTTGALMCAHTQSLNPPINSTPDKWAFVDQINSEYDAHILDASYWFNLFKNPPQYYDVLRPQ